MKAADFDAIVIPGGYSPDHMRRHPPMVDLVTQAARMGKVLAAICHGPWMLCSARCLQGRRRSPASSPIRDDVENAGGVWEDAACVRDGNLVTSRTPDDLPAFMQGIFAATEPSNSRERQWREACHAVQRRTDAETMLSESAQALAAVWRPRQ